MSNFRHADLLDLAECYACENNLIDSEDKLSDLFDEEVMEHWADTGYGYDDQIAINEAFSNWTDGLCKEGEIHSEQYDKYVYVGRWAND